MAMERSAAQPETCGFITHTGLEEVRDAAFILNRGGAVLAANESAVKLFSYSRENLLGKTLSALTGPGVDTQELLMPRLQRACDGVPQQVESRGRRADGGIFPQEIRLCPCVHAGVASVLALVQDTTERQLADLAVRENLERFHRLLQDIPLIAVQGYGPEGTTQYWNTACERLYGYTAQEAIGRNLVDLIIPPEMQDGVRQAITDMAATGQAIPASELSLMRKDRSRVAVFSSHVIVHVPGRSPELFCVDLDLTDLKRAEAERSQLEEQLRQVQKLESIGRLAGGVAHDFNNKLQIILGYVAMLMNALPRDQQTWRDTEEIQKAALHAAALTKQLLTFSRRQTIDPVVLELDKAIAGSLRMIVRLIGEDIRLQFTPPPELGCVFMDPTQLDQLLANLVLNARDAITNTGLIIITAANLTLTERDCAGRPDFVTPGDYITIAVRDNGSGMTPAIQAHIFEPFFTTKGQGQGTGLGLATVYGIVKQNRGAITVESVPGAGSTFTVYLPRHALPATPGTTDETANTPAYTGNETILLVEDEVPVLNLTKRALTERGYHVLPASTPAAALALCVQHPETIHLLLTDVVLPDLNGKDLAERIQQRRPGLRVLFMSGYSPELMLESHRLLPGVRLLQKPFSGEALAQQVRAALDA